jgi:hypothetical protein
MPTATFTRSTRSGEALTILSTSFCVSAALRGSMSS